MKRVSLLVCLLALANGCSQHDDTSESGATKHAVLTKQRALREEKIFGPKGELLESTTRIAGLVLPKGLTKIRETKRDHVFHIRATLTHTINYFGPRLTTGKVEQVAQGIIYREAVARGARGGIVKLDVSILPMVDGARVEVVELPPVPSTPVDGTAAVRELIQKQRSLD